MNRRLVLKTIFLCFGIFLLISSLVVWLMLKYVKFDTEEVVNVYTAAFQILDGTQINETVLILKQIKASAYHRNMIKNSDEIIGKIAVSNIEEGDYIRKHDIKAVSDIFLYDERIRAIPMDINARQANLVKKGMLVDINVKLNGEKTHPRIVLSKIKVEEVLDENGIGLGQNSNVKIAYLKLILDKEQRRRLEAAMDFGVLFCEIYGSSLQTPALEDFLVPLGY